MIGYSDRTPARTEQGQTHQRQYVAWQGGHDARQYQRPLPSQRNREQYGVEHHEGWQCLILDELVGQRLSRCAESQIGKG